jgi:serine/threonine-protein kinase
MLARPAAIKLVNPDLLGAADPAERETMVKRFEREAQATAAMRSPHTVGLFDFGAAEDGTFYYVMELLDGYDLDTLIKRFGPVPADRAIHLLRQVCHSLAEAHERGLIHRDIKPANIYACRYGRDADYVKVLDFGLVKRRRQGDDPKLTQTAFAGGTPAHMAPEQALGEGVDARTDLYALGCVAYWLVTGRLVFESETPLGMIADHARTPPLPPSAKGELPIPADLEAVIMRCLEKEPEARPQTAQELALALEACQGAEDWTNERAWAWWDLHGPEPVTGSADARQPPAT